MGIAWAPSTLSSRHSPPSTAMVYLSIFKSALTLNTAFSHFSHKKFPPKALHTQMSLTHFYLYFYIPVYALSFDTQNRTPAVSTENYFQQSIATKLVTQSLHLHRRLPSFKDAST